MSSEYESGKGSLKGLCSWYTDHEANRNEATTRLHLIDELLFQVLGWDKRADCIVEERLDNTYTDYELLCPRRTVIVEAKREGIYFEIPSGISNKQYNIKTLAGDVPKLGDAIHQAALYCQHRGAPFGVVTNGYQLIAFIGSRQDGLPPEDGRAIVFNSLDDMYDNFALLWASLSKSGVIEKNLFKKLVGTDVPIIPKKLSENIVGYPGIKNRNIIQTDLHILADLVFEDIVSARELEDQFLHDCYCQSGALSQYALISKDLLFKRYISLFPPLDDGPTLVPATTKDGISDDLIAESFSKRPILILGDVGVGKTMFFRYFIKIYAHDVFKDALVIYIDFGTQAAFTKDVNDFVADEVAHQLQQDYNTNIYERSFVFAVYHIELQQFEKGIYGGLRVINPNAYQEKQIEFLDQKIKNKEHFLRDCLKHISDGRRKQIVLFLDNADQRSDKIQQEVFVLAQAMATHWPVSVFLALRPETFQRSKASGSLSAYHLKAFSISPPRIDRVLEKRLRFGLSISSGKLKVTSLPPGISVDFQKVGIFLSIVLDSMKCSDEIIECLDNMSGGNVRLALEFVKRLIGSGHINTKKILDIYNRSGSYFIRLHEFLRSIVFGDAIYYDTGSSPIENVFDVESLDRSEHFLSLILLQFVSLEAKTSLKHGFVDVGKIYDVAQGLGYSVPQIDRSLSRLWKKKLLETAGRVKPVGEDIAASSLRITTIGAYHLKRLPTMFVYYDAIVTDTPILEEAFRIRIHDVADIDERLERGSIFLDYLDGCFKNLDAQRTGLDWSHLLAQAKKNIADIRSLNVR